jgi:hypothetical protein
MGTQSQESLIGDCQTEGVGLIAPRRLIGDLHMGKIDRCGSISCRGGISRYSVCNYKTGHALELCIVSLVDLSLDSRQFDQWDSPTIVFA